MKSKSIAFILIGILLLTGCSSSEEVYTRLSSADDDAQVVIKGITDDGDYHAPLVDSTTDAIATIEYEHNEIHEGRTYTVLEVVDLGNGAVRDILIITPDTTRWAHLVWEIEHELETTIQFYNDTTYSASGTWMQSFNRDGNSTDNATTLVYHTPTITDVGNLVGTIQQGDGKKAGGADRESNEFILKQNYSYLIRITNLTVNDNLIFIKLNWYEHINR